MSVLAMLGYRGLWPHSGIFFRCQQQIQFFPLIPQINTELCANLRNLREIKKRQPSSVSIRPTAKHSVLAMLGYRGLWPHAGIFFRSQQQIQFFPLIPQIDTELCANLRNLREIKSGNLIHEHSARGHKDKIVGGAYD